MYLSQLSNEKKHLFLDLEIYLSKVDGDFSDEERQIIDAHCIEMHIDNNNYECEFPLDTVISKLSNECSKQEKHIIFLELAAMVWADNVFHDNEKQLINRLAETLKISDDRVKSAFALIKQLKETYSGCAEFIKGE